MEKQQQIFNTEHFSQSFHTKIKNINEKIPELFQKHIFLNPFQEHVLLVSLQF